MPTQSAGLFGRYIIALHATYDGETTRVTCHATRRMNSPKPWRAIARVSQSHQETDTEMKTRITMAQSRSVGSQKAGTSSWDREVSMSLGASDALARDFGV